MTAAADFPISGVVQVDITRETLFPSRAGFGTALIVGTASVIDHGERVRFYSSIADVAGDFSTSDEEYIAAQAYFSQSPRPTRVAIGRALSADAAGFMQTGQVGTLAAFQAITDGEMRVTIDGVAQDISGLNFSGATDLDDVADIIETALQAVATGGFTAATCTYSGGRIKITSGTTGASSSVSWLLPDSAPVGTDITGSTLLNGLQGVARLVPGHVYASLVGEISAIVDGSNDWYGLAFTRDLRSQANYEAAAAWVEARTKILAAVDNSLTALDSGSTSDMPYQLQLSGYDRTTCWWHSDPALYPEVAFLGSMLTVDFNVPNSAATGKFKRLSGVSTVNITTSQLTALKAKNCNTYVSRGGIPITEEGVMASGEFFDTMHGVDWMTDAISVDVYGALTSESKKVPYTDAGAAVLEDAVRGVLDQAVAAGFIATDFDDEGNLVAAYTLSTGRVLDQPQTQRAARRGPPITFEGRLAGAIHFTTVVGTVTV